MAAEVFVLDPTGINRYQEEVVDAHSDFSDMELAGFLDAVAALSELVAGIFKDMAQPRSGNPSAFSSAARGVSLFFYGISFGCLFWAAALVTQVAARVFHWSSPPRRLELPNYELMTRDFNEQFRRFYERKRERESQNSRVLLNGETVFSPYEEDEVLVRYTCPITGRPIRHPMIDPSSRIMYEREAVEAWVRTYHTSPSTRGPLAREQLTIAVEAQGVIDNRLQELQQRRDAIVQRFQRHLDEQRREQAVAAEAEIVQDPQEREGTIPDEFEKDSILCEHICPITQSPVRYPVIDPTSGIVYERSALEHWVDLQHSSPITRRPLQRSDLVVANDIQEAIEKRLAQLQQQGSTTEAAHSSSTEEVHQPSKENVAPSATENPQPEAQGDSVQNDREVTARLRVLYFDKNLPPQ